ncbi:MgtC/SapB family protein [Elioraea rosea]|uniref:MgtC/SapB family protein n=1 Tax=Elioraea rosea TaxID=2492390 RepID=UPI001184113A|nr:DUF4010 domain-containing protein [Elioraea rosea]
MNDAPSLPVGLALALGLGFFLGLAYEEHYGQDNVRRPGGIRTFPTLSLTGAVLWLLEPAQGLAFLAFLLFVAASGLLYWRAWLGLQAGGQTMLRGGLMVPACAMTAAAIGPASVSLPSWIPVGLTMAVVLLIRARTSLHALAAKLPGEEITTAARFLVLAGVILPVLPREPIAAWLPVTPFQVWLAVVAMSAISWGTYLLQRYVSRGHGTLIGALLGGLWSSTAVTVALARDLRGAETRQPAIEAGIVAATAVMFVRVGVVAGVFNPGLGLALAPWLAGFSVAAGLAAGAMLLAGRGPGPEAPLPSGNPLRIPSALAFAALFIAISAAMALLGGRFGTAGVYAVGAIVGLGDLDAFTINLATTPQPGAVGAILLACASNNAVKGGYALAFGGSRGAWPGLALAALSIAGLAVALAIR